MRLHITNQDDDPVIYRVMEKIDGIDTCVSQMQVLSDQSTIVETTEGQWLVFE